MMSTEEFVHIVRREAARRRLIVKEALNATLDQDQREQAWQLFNRDYLDRTEFAIFQYASCVGDLLGVDDETVQTLRRQLAKTLLR